MDTLHVHLHTFLNELRAQLTNYLWNRDIFRIRVAEKMEHTFHVHYTLSRQLNQSQHSGIENLEAAATKQIITPCVYRLTRCEFSTGNLCLLVYFKVSFPNGFRRYLALSVHTELRVIYFWFVLIQHIHILHE